MEEIVPLALRKDITEEGGYCPTEDLDTIQSSCKNPSISYSIRNHDGNDGNGDKDGNGAWKEVLMESNWDGGIFESCDDVLGRVVIGIKMEKELIGLIVV